jgi:hypothetical protein
MNLIRLFIISIMPALVFSQIQINEFFTDNQNCCLDNFVETEDFVEIINNGPSPINLAGFYFGDLNSGSTIPSGFPEETTVGSGELFVIWYDEDLSQGPNHIDSKLNSSGETIIVINSDGDTIVNIEYGLQQEDVSFSSLPDGLEYSDEWSFTLCPSPGELNQDCPLIEGCTSSVASNYNSEATSEDGSCVFNTLSGVLINEYSASNCDNDGSDCGDYEDWIELYNNSPNPIDLQGYFLSDKISNIYKWQFPNSFIVEPFSYVVIYASGLDPDLELSSENTSFKLTQTRDTEYVVLSNNLGQILDYIKLSPNQLNCSMGRMEDASSEWRIFPSPTQGNTNNTATNYIGYTSTPSMNYSSGFYDSSVEISISSEDSDVSIYYTIDGSFPDLNSNLYTSPITFNNTTVLKAISYSSISEMLPSFIETNSYFINEAHSLVVISIAGELVDNLINGNQIRPLGSFEIFDVEGNLIDESVGEFNKHGNDSWAYDQRGLDYIIRDQYGYNYAINSPLFRIKERDSYQKLILKSAANDNYPFTFGSPAHIRDSYVHSLSQVGDLRLDERTHESCVLYVNGEYWGVYDFREKVDDYDFLDHYYGQGEGYVDFLKTWGNTWVEFGDNNTQNEWDILTDFIVDNDMTDLANYEYVKSVYNTGSLIDYFILNSYVVCMDWLNWNTAWWRGKNINGDKKKWRYVLWDMDATFGHYVNYTGIPDTGAGADPCDPETLGDPGGQGHVPILNALFENEDFTADYINRYADLSNTIFSCDFMISHLDSLIDIISPEMPRQIQRWGGSFNEWEENVQELRDYILTRCSDEFIEGMEECYDVEAVDVTIIIEGEGEVAINSIDIDTDNSPWNGIYYSGIPIELSASSSSGLFNFYWEVVDGDLVLEDPLNTNIIFDLSSSLTIIAHFDECFVVQTEEIVGPVVVEEGSIWQYAFPSEFTNTSEWTIQGGEVLFTSSTTNTIAVQWNYGTGQGQIVLSQYNFTGELECLFVNIEIVEGSPQTNLTDFNFQEDVLIFPNPSSDFINILINTNSIVDLSIYDMSGKNVNNIFNIPSVLSDHVMNLYIGGVVPGVYNLSIITKKNILHKSFIISDL